MLARGQQILVQDFHSLKSEIINFQTQMLNGDIVLDKEKIQTYHN